MLPIRILGVLLVVFILAEVCVAMPNQNNCFRHKFPWVSESIEDPRSTSTPQKTSSRVTPISDQLFQSQNLLSGFFAVIISVSL